MNTRLHRCRESYIDATSPAKRIQSLLLAMVFAIGLMSVSPPALGQDSAEGATTEAIIRPVKLLTLQNGAGGVTRQFFGQVVARQTVDLAFQESGQILQFPATEGEIIPEGDLVAELDLEPFELQLELAELQADQAARAFERLSQLTISVTQAQREDSQTELELARVAVRSAEVALNNATLTAPFDALVAARNTANFTTISQGTPVVRLHDMSELRIDIEVPEIVFQEAGEDPDVRLVARFPTSEQLYPLEVREFNAEASSVGQSFRITLALPQTDGLAALPGSSVTVLATFFDESQGVPIPATAVRIASDGSTSVMRFKAIGDDLGEVDEVPVELAATRDGFFEVLGGLAAGDEIVRIGAHALEDGQTVRRFEGFPQ